MKKLLLDQLRLFKHALISGLRLLRSALQVAITDWKEMKVSSKINRALAKDLLRKPQIIEMLGESSFPAEDVRITFAGAMRYIGNPNHKLSKFFDSLLRNANDVRKIEILLAIDSDDDLQYYLALKNKYGNRLRLRIFISPLRYGYEGLHLYDRMLTPLMAPNSKMMCDYSDDCIITLPNFDEALLKIDALHPDNIYFIQTRLTKREKFLGDVSKEPLRLLWMFQTHGCHSYFPIVSKGVLKCAEQALQALPADKAANWSPFANAWITDCYADMLGTYLRAEGINRVHELDMMVIKHGIYAHYQHVRDANGMSANNRAFITMLGQDTQQHLKHIVSVMAQTIRSAKV